MLDHLTVVPKGFEKEDAEELSEDEEDESDS